MAELSTGYLGLELRNPLIVAASGLTGSVEGVKKAVVAGAGAIVLKSLFEEQLRAAGYQTHRQQFTYRRHNPHRATLERTAPTPTAYAVAEDFQPLNRSGSGTVTAEVVPVVKLDGREIGTGKPGPLTAKFIEAFRRRVTQEGTRI